MGTTYLIHFDTPYKHARHYVGWTNSEDCTQRLRQHADCTGARLMQVIIQAGITWRLAKTWENTERRFERSLKKRCNSSRFCPICKAEKKAGDVNVTLLFGDTNRVSVSLTVDLWNGFFKGNEQTQEKSTTFQID